MIILFGYNCHNEGLQFGLSNVLTWIVTLSLAIWTFYQNQKIENLKMKIQKRVFVHKLQFEKEFEIYKELSQQLNILRDKISKLRAMGDNGEDNKNQSINEAVLESNKLINLTEINRPFYSEKIYQKLKSINQLITKEIIDVLYKNKNTEYWEEGIKTMEAYIVLIDSISDLIRERIGNMNEM